MAVSCLDERATVQQTVRSKAFPRGRASQLGSLNKGISCKTLRISFTLRTADPGESTCLQALPPRGRVNCGHPSPSVAAGSHANLGPPHAGANYTVKRDPNKRRRTTAMGVSTLAPRVQAKHKKSTQSPTPKRCMKPGKPASRPADVIEDISSQEPTRTMAMRSQLGGRPPRAEPLRRRPSVPLRWRPLLRLRLLR